MKVRKKGGREGGGEVGGRDHDWTKDTNIQIGS